jgi:hypothetical protein
VCTPLPRDVRTDELFFFAFDLLYLNGESTSQLPLVKRKERLQHLLAKEVGSLRFSDHVIGDGPRFREHACQMDLEGVISKRVDRPYAPGERGIWVKSKCLNREEFVVVGWTDPEGSRQHIGALLLGYYTNDGRLYYAGRAGTGMTAKELKRLATGTSSSPRPSTWAAKSVLLIWAAALLISAARFLPLRGRTCSPERQGVPALVLAPHRGALSQLPGRLPFFSRPRPGPHTGRLSSRLASAKPLATVATLTALAWRN